MPPPRNLVIVGGGLAAAKACQSLREVGFDGHIVLVGAEHHLPYERPPLSKGYLLGKEPLDDAFAHPTEFYDDNDIDLRLGTRVERVDRAGHTVTTDAETIEYDRLLLTTGATPRRLPMADDSGAPVGYLRTIEDSQRIQAELGHGRRMAILGGGWIGLEIAAAAASSGCDTLVVEPQDQPLLRVLGPEVGALFADLHREHGVDLRTGVSVESIGAEEGRAVLQLGDGTRSTADFVLVAVGVAPDSALAEGAGLETDNGILVDEHLRTSDPDVFAAGDVANAWHPRLGRRLRVEHWDNAIQQGRTAARNMLGAEEAYTRQPYFFTDQYDWGMEYVGNVGPDGYDEVVLRGEPGNGPFTAFWVKGDSVVAGMHINHWDATDPIRRIVDIGTVDLTALRDPKVPLALR